MIVAFFKVHTNHCFKIIMHKKRGHPRIGVHSDDLM